MKLIEVMDEKYWDKVAGDYDGEIFSCLANDREQTIAAQIRRFGSKKKIACDFGCGVGKFLPALAENFRYVYAIDLSEELVKQAKENCGRLGNITYFKSDLSKRGKKIKPMDFGLCVNVAIMPGDEARSSIFNAIARSLRKGGHLVLVVPSLESVLYADFRLVQWNLKSGLSGREAVWEIEQAEKAAKSSLREGLVEINGVATKHYLREELVAMFEDRPFEILSIEKVEYEWGTEFEEPPEWMGEPLPWDWMAVLRKIKN